MRVDLNTWLHTLITIPDILQTECMYSFLCEEANVKPSPLQILRPKLDQDSLNTKDGNLFDDNYKSQYTLRYSERVEHAVEHRFHDEAEEKKEIENVSTGQAEVMYDKMGNPAAFITLDAFDIIKVIGKGETYSVDVLRMPEIYLGSFGKVFLVRYKAYDTMHAMKALIKAEILQENQVEQTRTERTVLQKMHHPFVVGLSLAFQTKEKLFFVMDYCSGGELFFQLSKVGRFTHERTWFYAAQITLAIDYIHSLCIIYR